MEIRGRASGTNDTPCIYINQAAARVRPAKEFASRSIEHRAEKRLNALTMRPSWEEGRGPRKNAGSRKMHTDRVHEETHLLEQKSGQSMTARRFRVLFEFDYASRVILKSRYFILTDVLLHRDAFKMDD
jgi:hypothetical protein